MPLVKKAEPGKKAEPRLNDRNVRAYLASRFGSHVRVLGLTVLGQVGTADVKGYGYGIPVKVDYELDGQRCSAVLETVTPGGFGHRSEERRVGKEWRSR